MYILNDKYNRYQGYCCFVFTFTGYCMRIPARTKERDTGKHIAHFSFLLPNQRMSTDYYNFMSEVEKLRISIGKFCLIMDLWIFFVVLLLVLNRLSDHEEYNFTNKILPWQCSFYYSRTPEALWWLREWVLIVTTTNSSKHNSIHWKNCQRY